MPSVVQDDTAAQLYRCYPPELDQMVAVTHTSKVNANDIHLAFVFSQPLVTVAAPGARPFPMKALDFSLERDVLEILRLQDTKVLRFRVFSGTWASFVQCLRHRPTVLHFSGHLMENQPDLIVETENGNAESWNRDRYATPCLVLIVFPTMV